MGDSPGGFSMRYAGVTGAQQGLLDTQTGIKTTVTSAAPGCTAPGTVYPEWDTSSALTTVFSAYADTYNGHAADCGSYAAKLGTCVANVQTTERTNTDVALGLSATGE